MQTSSSSPMTEDQGRSATEWQALIAPLEREFEKTSSHLELTRFVAGALLTMFAFR